MMKNKIIPKVAIVITTILVYYTLVYSKQIIWRENDLLMYVLGILFLTNNLPKNIIVAIGSLYFITTIYFILTQERSIAEELFIYFLNYFLILFIGNLYLQNNNNNKHIVNIIK
jgi:hypothetical protein